MNKQRVTPLRAIRRKCLDCCVGSSLEVKFCEAQECSLYAWRSGKTPKERNKSSLKTIREKCLHDCGEPNSFSDVRDCPIKECPLYLFRLGKNPNYSEKSRNKARNSARKKLGEVQSHVKSLSCSTGSYQVTEKQKRLPLQFEECI